MPKVKDIAIFAAKISIIFKKLDRSAKSVLHNYVIVTNYGNWQRENLRLDRENTGNLKIQFEWIPSSWTLDSRVKAWVKNE